MRDDHRLISDFVSKTYPSDGITKNISILADGAGCHEDISIDVANP